MLPEILVGVVVTLLYATYKVSFLMGRAVGWRDGVLFRHFFWDSTEDNKMTEEESMKLMIKRAAEISEQDIENAYMEFYTVTENK